MRRITSLALVLSSCVFSTAAVGAAFDGSQPFVCASIELFSCVSGSECERETPESFNAPQFLFVDVQNKEIRGVRSDGNVRTSAIAYAHEGSPLDLHGVEDQFAWSMMVEPAGKMTLSAAGNVAGDRTALVIFGACTPKDTFESATAGTSR